MSVNACFSQIIGFSRKEDLCVADEATDWSADYAVSDSGLYIDELPGMPQRFIASLGGNYDIWEKMTNAMENAINVFKIDVLAEILKYKEPARERFKGEIGGKTFVSTLPDHTYHGLRMYSEVDGGTFTLRGVSLILNVTEAVTLEIYDEYDLLYSYNLTSLAGRPKYTAITPLVLPLDRNYYFLYQTTGLPYNNKLNCNCGGYKWCFDIESPCYKPSRDAWTQWAMIGGVSNDVLADRDDWGTSREAQGMILHGEFGCDILGTLCSDEADWSGNDVDLAIANAIWYKTGSFLANYIKDSEEVSRRTLLGTEQWNKNEVYYDERYAAMIDYIAQNFEDSRNECLQCKHPFGYSRKAQML